MALASDRLSPLLGLLLLSTSCMSGPHRIEYACGVTLPDGGSYFRSLSLNTGTSILKTRKQKSVHRPALSSPPTAGELPPLPALPESVDESHEGQIPRQRSGELAALASKALRGPVPAPHYPAPEGVSCTLTIFSPPEASKGSLSVVGSGSSDSAADRLAQMLTALLP